MAYNKIEIPGTTSFEFFEELPSVLQSATTFVVDVVYNASFKANNRLPFGRKLKLLSAQFTFDNNKNEIEITKKEQPIVIIFSPAQEGNSIFSLLLEKAGKETKIQFLNRILNAEKAKAAEEVSAQVVHALPNYMKLGQKADIIFSFTNNSSQAVTGVNIEIKQIDVQ